MTPDPDRGPTTRRRFVAGSLGGCPVGLMPPGVMTVWTGYMDGAVQAGKRALSEALAAL